MARIMTYEEYLTKVKDGILTKDGECPVTPVLKVLQGKWKSQVLYEFCVYRTVRFGQFKRDIPGITNTMLTTTLRELEKDGLIKRRQYNEIPPRVEYSFTKMGEGMLPIFYEVMCFGFKYENSLKKLRPCKIMP